MLKGAVFDMDGLMFDTERLVYDNWQSMMDEHGYRYDIEFFKRTIGKRKKEVELMYLDYLGRDFPYWTFADEGKARYVERIKREGIPVKKGLYDILDFCKDNGMKIALATSTSRQTSEFNLESAGVSRYFDALACGEEVKNGKPHPEVFLTAAKKLGLEPECCAAFEDSISGIKSAFAAGMTTVMVPDFLQPTEEIIPMISFLCKDLSEAKAYLEPLMHS